MAGDGIKKTLLKAISTHPGTNPSKEIQKTFGVSRQAVLLHLNALIKEGLIRAEGQARGRSYYPTSPWKAPLSVSLPKDDASWETILESSESLDKLTERGEDGVYAAVISPYSEGLANKGLSARLHYVSTEILNNVIDHSKGEGYRFALKSKEGRLRLEIEDDGIGIFQSIKEYFSLSDHWEAIGDLAKGKRTTDPSRHAGEGLFFSARMADVFTAEANGLKYTYVSSQDDWSMGPTRKDRGSLVSLEFIFSETRAPKDVFDLFTDDYEFKEKSPRLLDPYVISLPPGHLPSRSEAKKVLSGTEHFSSIVLDFKGVESIGQGFADEVFRVFPSRFPEIKIETKNGNEFILRMIAHVKR